MAVASSVRIAGLHHPHPYSSHSLSEWKNVIILQKCRSMEVTIPPRQVGGSLFPVTSAQREPSSFGAPSGDGDDVEVEDVENRFLRSSSGWSKHLRDLCTWRIGGPCRYFLEIRFPAQLAAAVRCCQRRSMPFLIVGKGSNCLFDSRGFDGCILLNRIETMETEGNGIYVVGSGYPFNRLGVQCSQEGFSGLEFAGGVPGTVGGAVFMNAGANGQETADVIESVSILSRKGELKTLKRGDLSFAYRNSIFQKMEDLAAILAVRFQLTACRTAERRQKDYLTRRQKTQPLREYTAGSVFRNPLESDMGAGELIEKAGLKGFKIGGAKVSEVHGNFFVNSDQATSGDMLALINHVKEKVEKKFSVHLEEEVRIIPYTIQ